MRGAAGANPNRNPSLTPTATPIVTPALTQTQTQTQTLPLTVTLTRRYPRPSGRCTPMVADQCMRCWPGALPARARPRAAGAEAEGNQLRLSLCVYTVYIQPTAVSRPWVERGHWTVQYGNGINYNTVLCSLKYGITVVISEANG